MVSTTEKSLWVVVAAVLVVFSVPWFLWGEATTVAGLPVWLWWHILWMFVASVAFYVFGRRAWGIGIDVDVKSAEEGSE